MISITSTSFDALGYLEIDPKDNAQAATFSRRVSRAATLDGGVVISDRGFSDGDRTLAYSYKPVSKEHDSRAERLVRLHPTVNVSTPDGVFLAVPQSFSRSSTENTITLLAIRKVSEE